MAATVGGGASVARVRLPTDAGSATAATSRTRTLSHDSDEAESETAGTVMGNGNLLNVAAASTVGFAMEEDLRSVVSRLEAMQARQRSPQQPCPELDAELCNILLAHPEWRPRMAVATKSALLRKKILSAMPEGGRAVGSSGLGSTHPWRSQKVGDYFTDHNWPAASTHGDTGIHFLSGGGNSHDALLRAPAHKLKMHPLLSHTPYHSIPRAKRFPGTKENGQLDYTEVQRRANPGPGTYFKSQPRGTQFSMDGGETQILGANHVCPWKKCLGHHINPAHVDISSVKSAPCWSFSKTRRACSETSLGHGRQDGGPAKTDAGCLSPGPVYEHFGTMRPSTDKFSQSSFGIRRRAHSSGSMPRIRMVPVPVEEPPLEVDEFLVPA